MSSMEQSRARERSPGTESFYSAREEDTASLASFYMDAYDDLTADEYQSAEESERETTPVGRDSSAESTPRQTPMREARKDELPKRFEKRHSHDYGSVFHREAGRPLILQRSSSCMRDGPFGEQSKMQSMRSYSSVDYLNDSYDQSRPGRRPPPDRKRQRQISLERMAQKERGASAEPELRSEIRLAFESPFDVPLPQGDELEKLKKRLSSLKPADDDSEIVGEVPSRTGPGIQSIESEPPTVPRRTKARDSSTLNKGDAPEPTPPLLESRGQGPRSVNESEGNRSLLVEGSHTTLAPEEFGIGAHLVHNGPEIEKLQINEIGSEAKQNSEARDDEIIPVFRFQQKSLADNNIESFTGKLNDRFEVDSFSFLRLGIAESVHPDATESNQAANVSNMEAPTLPGEESFEIIPTTASSDVDHEDNLPPPERRIKLDDSPEVQRNAASRFPESKPLSKDSASLFRDSRPKFSRTASFESTPVLVHKPMGSFDLQFDLDRSPSRELSPFSYKPARPTTAKPVADDKVFPTDAFSDLSFPSWKTPMRRRERAKSPLSGLPPRGRNSSVAPVASQDIPKRPARTKRAARSAGASRQHSVTRDETRDSTRDLQEQIQNLLSSLQKKLNKSSSLGRSPNLTDESAKYDSDGRNSITASNSSLSWKPTRYSSIRREATMEKLENILSTSSEAKKNIPTVFDAESIEELTTYGHIGNYEAADKKDSKIFEEFDKHFDLMLEADSGEEDDFVKIVDESVAAQSFRMSVVNGNKDKFKRGPEPQDLNNASFESNRAVPPVSAVKSSESDGPPPVPAKRRTSRISAQTLPQQQIIEMQNQQLRELQRHQEELERKMKLLQEQIELRKALDEERAPSIPVKCKSSKQTATAEGFYNALSFANPALYHESVILPSDEDFFNLQTNLMNWDSSACDLNSHHLNSSVLYDPLTAQTQANYFQPGEHRSPAERADTSGNLQIPYDDFVFEVGSPVGVMLPPDLRLGSNAGGGMAYGVVRWAGYINDEPMLGLEMDEDAFNGGYLNDVFYFECEPGKGFFARPEQCVPDERIQQMTLMDESPHDDHALTVAYDSLPGDFPPLFNVVNSKDLSLLVGRCKGIQGHHNSCYLDATLFAMFTTTSVFDFILDRPREEGDIPEYEEVTRVLKEDIVNSIRVHRFVGAAQVMKLRELLDKLGSVSGLTCEEKDPEEFLNCLTQMLQVEPFLHLSSGQTAHLYQMFVEKDEDLGLPWFQQILEQSFFQQELKLQQMPSVFIVQMPRFGRQFKVYPRVLPSFQLDMTDLLMNSPRPCHICASLAHLECIDCYQQTKSIEKSTFCDACYNRKHLRLSSHQASSKRLTVSAGFQDFSSTKHLPRQTMELFALLCIETSHYVAFVKCGQQSNSPWVFFDSMADRQGQNNIPEVVNFDDIYEWLTPEKLAAHPDDRSLPPLVKKIVSDAYMCFYRSNTVAMYN